ncbi:hypothetical protein [Pseudomonas sp. Snoq117.2]|uniref:hypothetical protein n=1 Tax=Pseudomonas sp. Snoq117.2 TaxID=1500302 RepID=UPI0008D118DF|nr:hypothetical protein [Pseudomonas sp. Snoq117.2]SEP41294.1 hypothetical protein SAMN02787149_110104 [Pseudomonas sp. Snoq117.2]
MQHVNVHTGEIVTLETVAFTGGFSADDYAPVVSTGKVFDADGNEFVFSGTADQLAQDHATAQANLARILAGDTGAKDAVTKGGAPRKRAAGAGRKSLSTTNPHAAIIRHALSYDLDVDWLDDLIVGVLTRPEEDHDEKFQPFKVSPSDVRRMLQHDKISSSGAKHLEIGDRQAQRIAQAARTAVAVVGSHIERNPSAIAHIVASMVAEAEASEAVAARVVVNAGEVPAEILALYEDGQFAAYGAAVRAFRDGSWKSVKKQGFSFIKAATTLPAITHREYCEDVPAPVVEEDDEPVSLDDVSLDDLDDDESLINYEAVDTDYDYTPEEFVDDMAINERFEHNEKTAQAIRDLFKQRADERQERARGKRPSNWALKQQEEDAFYEMLADAESHNENFIF